MFSPKFSPLLCVPQWFYFLTPEEFLLCNVILLYSMTRVARMHSMQWKIADNWGSRTSKVLLTSGWTFRSEKVVVEVFYQNNIKHKPYKRHFIALISRFLVTFGKQGWDTFIAKNRIGKLHTRNGTKIKLWV